MHDRGFRGVIVSQRRTEQRVGSSREAKDDRLLPLSRIECEVEKSAARSQLDQWTQHYVSAYLDSGHVENPKYTETGCEV